MTETYRDEADAADEVREDEPAVTADDAPEADALEQATPVRPPAEERPDSVGDAPEADALEQARAVEDDEADDRR